MGLIYDLKETADDHFRTHSDIGSIKVGNNDFTYFLRNDFGDGDNDIFVFNDFVLLEGKLSIEGHIEGKFNIYDYDCGNNIARTLEGSYTIYKKECLLVFVKDRT